MPNAPGAIAAAETEAPPKRRKRKPRTPEQRQRHAATERERRAACAAAAQLPKPSYTLRQRAFIEAYLRLGQVVPAAREAGYSLHTARYLSGRLLRRPDVQALIEARQAEMRRQSEVTMERVIGELAKLAFADPRDLFTADGKLKPVHALDDASAASIAALDVLVMASTRRGSSRRAGAESGTGESDGVEAGGDTVLELRKIKRWDKTKALELLGRYLGLFKDRIELGVSADLAASIEAARKRAQALPAPAAMLVEGQAVEVGADADIDADAPQQP